MTIMHTRNNRRLGFTLIELMLVIAIIAILAAILTPSFLKARAQSQLTACKSNVKNIGTACEMFAIDRKGRYPEQIAFLTLGAHGGYLKSIPSCPAAGSDTYSASYTFASNPDCFTVRCGGANHVALNIPEGYPLYDSVVGLACTGEPGGEVASAGGSEASAAQKAAEEAAAQQKAAEEAAQKAAAEAAAQKAAEEAAQKAAAELAAQKAAEEAAQKAAAEAAAQKAAEEAAAQRTATIEAGRTILKGYEGRLIALWGACKNADQTFDFDTFNAQAAIICAEIVADGYTGTIAYPERGSTNPSNLRYNKLKQIAYYAPMGWESITEYQLYQLGLTHSN